ncbi:hypothetical protein A9X05_24310 [Mycobacterium sp. E3298]|nr:hypothetical protein A9X05_24310 [Mycobacterium sp. E3298]
MRGLYALGGLTVAAMLAACPGAAAALGFRTAFVARPMEFGADGEADVAYSDEFDVNASDFLDLAAQLGR